MTNEQVDNGTVGVMDSNIQDEVDSLEEKVTFFDISWIYLSGYAFFNRGNVFVLTQLVIMVEIFPYSLRHNIILNTISPASHPVNTTSGKYVLRFSV